MGYDFPTDVPNVDSSALQTLSDFVTDGPQYAVNFVSQNMELFLLFVLVTVGFSLVRYLGALAAYSDLSQNGSRGMKKFLKTKQVGPMGFLIERNDSDYKKLHNRSYWASHKNT